MEAKKSPGLVEGHNDRERTKGGMSKRTGPFVAAEEGVIKQGAEVTGFNWVGLFTPYLVLVRIK